MLDFSKVKLMSIVFENCEYFDISLNSETPSKLLKKLSFSERDHKQFFVNGQFRLTSKYVNNVFMKFDIDELMKIYPTFDGTVRGGVNAFERMSGAFQDITQLTFDNETFYVNSKVENDYSFGIDSINNLYQHAFVNDEYMVIFISDNEKDVERLKEDFNNGDI